MALVCSSSIAQVGKFEKPTWRKLVEAAEDKVGGNNLALAQNIAGEHPAASGNTWTCRRGSMASCKCMIVLSVHSGLNSTQLHKGVFA